jgi:hypothetical protein
VTAGSPARQNEDACWREAARLRAEYQGWLVIWLAAEGCYRAYRHKPGARRDTALSAVTPAELAALICQAEQAAGRPAHSSTDT